MERLIRCAAGAAARLFGDQERAGLELRGADRAAEAETVHAGGGMDCCGYDARSWLRAMTPRTKGAVGMGTRQGGACLVGATRYQWCSSSSA